MHIAMIRIRAERISSRIEGKSGGGIIKAAVKGNRGTRIRRD
jgi:DNA-binding protein YbaB